MTVIIWSWKPNKPRKHTNPHLHTHYNLLWFSCSVMSNSLRPHGLQHARLPCLSLSPGACSNPIVAISSCPQSFPASGSSSESALHIRCPNYWSFSFSICPSNEYSGLISFRIDWFDLLAVQGTLKSLLQHHSSKASIILVLSFLYSPTPIHTWLLEKPQPWLDGPLLTK